MAKELVVPLTEKVMLTVEEAAQLLSMGTTKAYELVAQGRIPSVRLGPRCTRVPRAALEAWASQAAEEAAKR